MIPTEATVPIDKAAARTPPSVSGAHNWADLGQQHADGLRLHEVTVAAGGRELIRDVTLHVPRGHITGLVGTNGAGKSTTMRAVLGLIRTSGGRISWDRCGMDAATRRRIGYMPEERGLYPQMTVLEQLVYHARLHGMTRRQAERAAAVWGRRVGLDSPLAARVQTLSLGNQQRVQVATALVHAPDLLVLDEPFSGLDPVGVDTLSAVLREHAAAGASVLLSSHQLELVESLCDTVTVISAGRIRKSAAIHAVLRGAQVRLRVFVDPTEPEQLAAVADRGLVAPDAAAWPIRELTARVGSGGQALELLAYAEDRLPVRDFRIESASLHEVLREALSDD